MPRSAPSPRTVNAHPHTWYAGRAEPDEPERVSGEGGTHVGDPLTTGPFCHNYALEAAGQNELDLHWPRPQSMEHLLERGNRINRGEPMNPQCRCDYLASDGFGAEREGR